jgi:very-short-patch-repair endonuclease
VSIDTLLFQLKAVKAPEPVLEYPFAKSIGRRWRFDAAWPDLSVAVEVDGGAFVGGRHVTGTGFEKDAEKMSTAAAMGWRVLRITPRMIEDGRALRLIEEALAFRWDAA